MEVERIATVHNCTDGGLRREIVLSAPVTRGTLSGLPVQARVAVMDLPGRSLYTIAVPEQFRARGLLGDCFLTFWSDRSAAAEALALFSRMIEDATPGRRERRGGIE